MSEALEKGMGYVVMEGKVVLSCRDEVGFSETLLWVGRITIKIGFSSIQKRNRLDHPVFKKKKRVNECDQY